MPAYIKQERTKPKPNRSKNITIVVKWLSYKAVRVNLVVHVSSDVETYTFNGKCTQVVYSSFQLLRPKIQCLFLY